jgi:hypothetical protein
MSATICASASVTSPESYTRWATALRRASLQRRKLALRTSANASSFWPTAKVSTGDYCYSNGNHSTPALNLSGAARRWKTPLSLNHGETGNIAGQSQLGIQVRHWRTPSDDSKRGGAANAQARIAQGHTLNLQDQAASWASPHGRQDQTTPHGQTSSNVGRKLNPLFVEWLMGWPIGSTGFDSAAMESSRRWQQRHGSTLPLTLPLFEETA